MHAWISKARMLLVVCAGCSGPQMLYQPPESTRVQGDGYSITYIETPYATAKPRLLVRLEEPDAGGERPAEVRVVDNFDRDLRRFRNVFDTDEYSFEVPFQVDEQGGPDEMERALTLLVERFDGPPMKETLRVHLKRVEAMAAPMEAEDFSDFGAWTYVVWGSWRDLLDVPFTALTRAGLSTARIGDSEPNASNTLVLGGAAAGAMIGAYKGYKHADDHFLEQGFYAGAGSLAGAAIGAAAAVVFTGVFEFVLVPVATGLFRYPADSDFIKHEVNAVPVTGDDALDLAAYDATLRSRCYFPNWRYGVRRVQLVPAERSRSIWIVTELAIDS